MRVGITYDLPSDYGISEGSLIFADFCHPGEVAYMEAAINRNGFEAVPIGNMYHLNERIKEGRLDCDIVFVCDEGISSRNREIIVPALLELNNIPYIGSDAYCMGLTQNKHHSKLIAQSLGIRCPKGIYLEYKEGIDYKEEKERDRVKKLLCKEGLSFPLIVKPNEEGYSCGVYLVRSDEELFEALAKNFFHYKEPVLVEEFIPGKELFVPMLGTGESAYALPVGAVVAEDGSDVELYSVEDKCGDWSHYEAVTLDPEVMQEMTESSLKIYRHLECRDLGRCDFRLDKEGKPVMIEVTPRPGLTEGGPYESCANAAGKTYDDVLREVIINAAKRYGIEVE